jgi:hypothetical protein
MRCRPTRIIACSLPRVSTLPEFQPVVGSSSWISVDTSFQLFKYVEEGHHVFSKILERRTEVSATCGNLFEVGCHGLAARPFRDFVQVNGGECLPSRIRKQSLCVDETMTEMFIDCHVVLRARTKWEFREHFT